MNPRTVEDLMNHAHRKINAVFRDTAQLFDDQDEQNVFFLGLYGRLLCEVARMLHQEDGEKELSGEALMTTAAVLAFQIDRGVPAMINQERAHRRGMAIAKKIRAAAGRFSGDA